MAVPLNRRRRVMKNEGPQWWFDMLRDIRAEREATAATPGRYAIKCDGCKREIGKTDELRVSAAGGRCEDCRAA